MSGLSYLHKLIKGQFTSHHNLKPKNILMLDGELKIADLGRSHLRSLNDGSETGGAAELGTYEYQPPEYWNADGSRTEIKYGRAFDVWSMGCIILELATLIVYGWESKKVSEFSSTRKEWPTKDRMQILYSRNGIDSSFHNNMIVVNNWREHLKRDGKSKVLEDVFKCSR